jgi:hypothetical protein
MNGIMGDDGSHKHKIERWTYLRAIKFEVISHHPDDGDGVGLRKVGFYNSSDAAVCPREHFVEFFCCESFKT